VIVREPNLRRQKKKREWGYRFRNVLDSQSRLELIDCVDAIGAISVGDGGVLLIGIVAEQQHFLAVEGIFRPSDI